MEVMVKAPGPLLVKVTLWAELVVLVVWLGKVRLPGCKLTVGMGAAPVPDKPMDCGLPLPLSVMLTDAAREPVAVGVKVTLMVQEAFAARVDGLIGQVLV